MTKAMPNLTVRTAHLKNVLLKAAKLCSYDGKPPPRALKCDTFYRQNVSFSRHGTLLNTAATLVTNAPAGYFTDELEAVVQVPAKDALRHLAHKGRLYRRELEGRYLYCAAERGRRQQQWAARQAQQTPEDDLQAAIVLFYGLLDEQQRRLYAGLESLEWGHGGDQRMAQLFGLDVDTVARGRTELMSGQVLPARVRRAGGGRPRAEKKRPSC